MTARRISRFLVGGQPLGALATSSLGFPAGLDGLGQPDLVVLGQQRVLTDVCQIEPYEILVVALNSFLRQDLPNLPSL
jgi:hypothetical protein